MKEKPIKDIYLSTIEIANIESLLIKSIFAIRELLIFFMNLKDKKILVTGSSSGIGKAIAIECAKQKCAVIIHYRNNKKGAEKTLEEVEKYSKGIMISADLSQHSEVKKVFNKLKEQSYGNLDGLVNNAGEATSGEYTDLSIWDKQWQNIFMSQLYVTNAFVNANKSKDIKKIINISSVYGIPEMGNPDFPQYSAAKAAINSLSYNFAKKLAPSILVNVVAPGYVLTPAWKETPKQELEACKSLTRIKRFIEPYEIASVVTMLLQNDAITGEIIRVDGGLHLHNIL